MITYSEFQKKNRRRTNGNMHMTGNVFPEPDWNVVRTSNPKSQSCSKSSPSTAYETPLISGVSSRTPFLKKIPIETLLPHGPAYKRGP